VFQQCTVWRGVPLQKLASFLEPEPVDPDEQSSAAQQDQPPTVWEPAPESGQVFEELIRQIPQRDAAPRAPGVAPPGALLSA
jgi:hypothetical protein